MSAATQPLVYRLVLYWTALESFVVFAKPIAFRVSHDGWKLYTGNAVMKNWVVDAHALTALLWIVLFLFQFSLGQRADRGAPGALAKHRRLGRFLLFVTVPVMSALAVTTLIMNPLSFPPFLVANTFFMWGLSTLLFALGIVAIRRGQRSVHVDAMYMAFVVLSGISTYRVVLITTYLSTGTFWTTLPGIVTWIVVLLKTLLPLAVLGRFHHNRVAALLLTSGFLIFGGWGLHRGLFTSRPPPDLAPAYRASPPSPIAPTDAGV